MIRILAVDLKNEAISSDWLAPTLIDHDARDLMGGGAGFAPYVLDPAAGHALFLQKTLPEN